MNALAAQRLCMIFDDHLEIIIAECTFKGCDQPQKWACSKCLTKGLHGHKLPNNNHLKKL